MHHVEHPAWKASLRHAIERANADKGACFSVWWDGEAVFVRASEAAGPPRGRVICIAQHWDKSTVQVRYPGGHSEWINL